MMPTENGMFCRNVDELVKQIKRQRIAARIAEKRRIHLEIEETDVPNDLRILWDLVTHALPGDPAPCSAQEVRKLLEEIITTHKQAIKVAADVRELREYTASIVARFESMAKQ